MCWRWPRRARPTGTLSYDGIISGDDYTVIDFNILAQGAPFPTATATSEPAVIAVPEPTALLPAITAALLLRRRNGRLRRSA